MHLSPVRQCPKKDIACFCAELAIVAASMNIKTLHQVQEFPLTLDQAGEFFSTPANLNRITPPDLGFTMTYSAGDTIYEGQIITYRIRVAPLIHLPWVTEIRSVKEGHSFIDVQLSGPYSLWHHRHLFEETPTGVRMTDLVHYALPFGPCGSIAHALFVRKKLHWIFDYRRRMLEEYFNPRSEVERQKVAARL